MEHAPTPNRHARRAAVVSERRRYRAAVILHALRRGRPPSGAPCGVRRYSVSRAVRELEASGEKARPR